MQITNTRSSVICTALRYSPDEMKQLYLTLHICTWKLTVDCGGDLMKMLMWSLLNVVVIRARQRIGSNKNNSLKSARSHHGCHIPGELMAEVVTRQYWDTNSQHGYSGHRVSTRIYGQYGQSYTHIQNGWITTDRMELQQGLQLLTAAMGSSKAKLLLWLTESHQYSSYGYGVSAFMCDFNYLE